MRLVALLDGQLFMINEVDKTTWDNRHPKGIVGVPAYFYQEPGGGVYVWPKPLAACEVLKLEPTGWVKE